MNEKSLRSRRLILRDEQIEGEAIMEGFCARLGWPRRSEREEDREDWLPRQIVWGAGPAIVLHYQEDLLSDVSYAFAVGHDLAVVRSVEELCEQKLPVWTLLDLLESAKAVSGNDGLAYAIHRLGMGAPREFNESVHSCIVDAMQNEDLNVRESAVWATTYEPWREYLKPLKNLLASDPQGPLSGTVRNLLLELEKEGSQ